MYGILVKPNLGVTTTLTFGKAPNIVGMANPMVILALILKVGLRDVSISLLSFYLVLIRIDIISGLQGVMSYIN